MFRDQRARELAVKLTSGTRFSNETAKVGTPGRNEPLLRSFAARFASNGMKVPGELYAQSPRRVKTRILAGETEPGKTVLRVAGPAPRNGPVYRFDAIATNGRIRLAESRRSWPADGRLAVRLASDTVVDKQELPAARADG